MNRRKKIRGFNFKIPKGDPFPIKTSRDMIKAPFITLAVAARGSGKTLSVVNMARQLMLDKTLDRVFLICPTYWSNKSTYDLIDMVLDEDDIYEEPNYDSLNEIIEKMEDEARDLEEYKVKMKRYKQLMKNIAEGLDPTDLDMLEFYSADGGATFDPPTHRWKGKKPICLCIIDDCQNTKLFNPYSPLNKLAITHRHSGLMKTTGTAIGLSLIICCQNYTSQGFGISRAIRNNVTNLMIFKLKDKASLDKIQKEMGAVLNEDKFYKLYEEGTREKYGFLFIDFFPKEHHPSAYRKCFNEFIDCDEN